MKYCHAYYKPLSDTERIHVLATEDRLDELVTAYNNNSYEELEQQGIAERWIMIIQQPIPDET